MRKVGCYFRAFFLVICLLLLSASWAQDTLTPKWTVFGSPGGKASYASTGLKILATHYNGFSIYEEGTGAVLAHEEWLNFQDAAFSSDAKDVFYSVKAGGVSKIYRYHVVTRERTALPGISETAPIYEITASKDGKKLGYSTSTGTGSTWKIHLYSLETSSMLAQFDHASVPQMRFVESDAKVLLSGPTLCDLSGTVVRSTNSSIGDRFDLTPDGASVITFGGTQIHSFNYSNFTSRWNYTNSRTIYDAKVTQDSGSIVFTVNAAPPTYSTWQGFGLMTTTGAPNSISMLSGLGGNGTSTPGIAVSPTTSNKIVLLALGAPILRSFKYSSTREAVTGGEALNMGQVLADRTDLPSPIRFTTAHVSGVPVNCVSVGLEVPSESGNVALFDQSTGKPMGGLPASGGKMTMPSPQGRYLFGADWRGGLSAWIWGDLNSTASTVVDPANYYGGDKSWANDGLIWVNKGADRGILQIRYDGKALTKGRLIKGAFDIAAMTSDESRIAMRDTTTGAVKVYNAASGASIGSIAPLSTEPVERLQFIAGNRLVVCEFNATAHENSIRIYDVTGSPVLLHSFTESATGDRYDNCGIVSPGGNYFAFGHTEVAGSDDHIEGAIHVYRVSDGLIVRRWANQYLGRQLAMEFTPDEFMLTWVVGSGMLTAAVIPSMPTNFTVSPSSVSGAATVKGTVTLNRVANQDTVIRLASSSSSVTLPSTVTVPSGSSSVSFDITTTDVVAPTNATLSATLGGATASTGLAMTPSVYVNSLSLSGNDLTGNTTVDLTVNLNAAAPAGFSVAASSNAAAVVVPSSVSFTEGATAQVVTLAVKKVTADKTVTVTIGGQSIAIRLHAPQAAVTSLTANPTELTGAGSIDITINLDKPAPAGFSVSGASNAAAIVVPATISIPEGATSYVLTVSAKKVTADRIVKITIGGKIVTVTLHKP